MRSHIKVRFNDELGKEYYLINGQDKHLDNIADFDTWVLEVAGAETHDGALAINIANIAGGRGTASAPSASQAAAAKENSTPTVRGPRIYVYKLTSTERQLLLENDGCLKCRKLFAGYFAADCPTGNTPLLLVNYKPITAELVTATKAVRVCTATTKSTRVAAVFEAESSSDEDGNVELDENASEYVLPDHLIWSCDVIHPSICPASVTTLIDHGAPPAMISDELVSQLNLSTRKLHRPFCVSGVFSSNKTDEFLEVVSFVKLSVQSPCAQWRSRLQMFIVCPSLHTDIILGLDFLTLNNIVVDVDSRTVIDKKTNFDLLNPPNPTLVRCLVKASPAEHWQSEKKAIKDGQMAT
ncbi:hypothetical protein LshimejAT787_0402310 [Lyophyllum shimeji]|uniref:Uncharacterized protein n=1 Tax=Lyophyllum shimeji TaxID=47721 RepID=A0A9P3UMV4_LYOSH|nr:hypothetical protein LshimejAT787_0402310 [Lyophyllum shimeji]